MLCPNALYIIGYADNTPSPSAPGYVAAKAQVEAAYPPILPGVNFSVGYWFDYAGVYGAGPFRSLPLNTLIIAHSFGGGAAIRAARVTNGSIPGMVLLDPIDCLWWGPGACVNGAGNYTQATPWGAPSGSKASADPFPVSTGNIWDWQLPANVRQAICHYRDPLVTAPIGQDWSAPLQPAGLNQVKFLRTINHSLFPVDPLVLATVKLAMEVGT